MARFKLIQRDTNYLFPPSMSDWLPEHYLSRLVEVKTKMPAQMQSLKQPELALLTLYGSQTLVLGSTSQTGKAFHCTN